jgi:hypothetical protein
MSKIKFDQTPGKPRGHGYYPQLRGLGRKCEQLAEQTTDRGLTGPAARDGDDVRARLDKRAAKLARRASRAGG